MYTYKAIVTSVYDGDTVTCDIDLGLNMWTKGQKIRLLGVDTPELRGDEREAGLKARDFVRGELMPNGEQSEIVLVTYKDRKGKYGRWLGEIFYGGGLTSLNVALADMGYVDVAE